MGTPLGEAMLAVVGLGPVLGEGRAPWNESIRSGLERIPDRIRKAVRDYLTSTTWDKPRSPGPVEWRPWVEKMATPPDRNRLLDVVAALPPEEAGAYVLQATEAWRYLAELFPPTRRPTLTGSVPEPPPDAYLYRFRRSYTVLDDPIGLLEQMNAGLINADESAAFQALFPTLYAETQRTFILETHSHKAQHPRWELPRKRYEPLRILLGLQRAPGYVQTLQARFAMPEPKDARTPGTLPRDPGESSQTPTQRAEMG